VAGQRRSNCTWEARLRAVSRSSRTACRNSCARRLACSSSCSEMSSAATVESSRAGATTCVSALMALSDRFWLWASRSRRCAVSLCWRHQVLYVGRPRWGACLHTEKQPARRAQRGWKTVWHLLCTHLTVAPVRVRQKAHRVLSRSGLISSMPRICTPVRAASCCTQQLDLNVRQSWQAAHGVQHGKWA
jgi:hypothetical protein